MHRYLAGTAILATLALGSCDGSTGPEDSDLILSSSSHDFGVISVGVQSSAVPFTITNGRTDANTVASVRLSGPAMAEFAVAGDDCTGAELAVQGTCRVEIRLRPSTSGKKEATLTVTDRHGNSTTAALVGLGSGVSLRANTTIEFHPAAVGTPGESRAVRITNGGFVPTGPLSVELSGGDVADFPIVGDACAGIQLPPAADCLITVRFAPVTGGRRTATIRVSGDPGGTVVPTLTGLAGSPVTLQTSPAARDFGSVNVGTISPIMLVTVTNTATTTSANLATRMTGDASDQFRVQSSTCGNRTLPPAGSCQVFIQLEPTSPGAKSAVLWVEDPFGSSATAELTGRGESIGLAVTPDAVDFPVTMAGSSSAPVTVTVTNTGTGTSGGLSVFDGGCYYYGPCDEFVITDDLCSENSLAPGASCTFALVYRPSSLGPASTTITAYTDGAVALVPTSGNANGLHLSVQFVDFAPTPVGSASAVQTVTVTNTGALATGTISALVDRADFEVTANSCGGQLAAGASCTIQLRFRALTPGLVQGSIAISATPGGWTAVTLRGTGT
jgi:hypothetical protein